MKTLKKIIVIDLIIFVLSACAADSATPIPLFICAISVLLLIPLALIYTEMEDDED